MSNPQPGWYPDPADAARQRYWAGDAWTAETRDTDAAKPADPYAAYAGAKSPDPSGLPAYAPPPLPAGATVPHQGTDPTTADGVPLAGWWWRVLAAIIDSLALGVVGSMLVPIYGGKAATGAMDWLHDLMNAATSGSDTVPSPFDPTYGIGAAMITNSIVSLVLAVVYAFLMLTFVGATLGQLACGLRVVPVDKGLAPRRVPLYSVIMRIVFYTLIPAGAALISLVVMSGNTAPITVGTAGVGLGGLSLLTSLVGLYQLLNVLWPLWDHKRQCLHDKIARTQVVRTR